MQPWGFGRRAELEAEVAAILATETAGTLRVEETQSIDFKEEAGRRIGSVIEPGRTENPTAAGKLANEVACFANTPGGGVIVLGVEHRTGVVIGTELDADWLRQRIYRAVDVAPDVREARVGGQRILVLFVAEAPEPVTMTDGRTIRWRVGDSYEPVDRAQWWEHRSTRLGYDPMAAASTASVDAVSATTAARVRDLLGESGATTGDAGILGMLRRIGAVRGDGELTVAAELLLTPLGRPALELTVLDVPGGRILDTIEPRSDRSLLEQLDTVESALGILNERVDRIDRFAASPQRMVPPPAIREAILNGLIHRDWNSREATDVRWIREDATLVVRSPGGFTGGVNAGNVLSNRHSRYPALADLCRALGLVEKQGVGVDRMYQAMIVLGHDPPRIEETAGPHVVCTLVGGLPVYPVLDLVQAIRPTVRQNDYRVAILIHLLLHAAFVTETDLAAALQENDGSVRDTVRIASQTVVAGEPLVVAYKNVWIFGQRARDLVRAGSDTYPFAPTARYLSTDPIELRRTTERWLARHDAITTGDLVALTDVSRGTAQRFLNDQVDVWLEKAGAGRASRFILIRG